MATGFRPVYLGRSDHDDYTSPVLALGPGLDDGIATAPGAGSVSGPFALCEHWQPAAFIASYTQFGAVVVVDYDPGDVVETIDRGLTDMITQDGDPLTLPAVWHKVSQGEAIDEFTAMEAAGLASAAPTIPEPSWRGSRDEDFYPIRRAVDGSLIYWPSRKRNPYGYVAILDAHGLTP